MSESEIYTLSVKNEIIKSMKGHFRFHNRLNVTEYVEAYPDYEHNHNGVARDICDKLKATGKYAIIEEGTKPIYWAVKEKGLSFKERYWWVILVIGWIIGLVSDIPKEWLKRKMMPEKIEVQPNTPKVTDTLTSHKNHFFYT